MEAGAWFSNLVSRSFWSTTNKTEQDSISQRVNTLEFHTSQLALCPLHSWGIFSLMSKDFGLLCKPVVQWLCILHSLKREGNPCMLIGEEKKYISGSLATELNEWVHLLRKSTTKLLQISGHSVEMSPYHIFVIFCISYYCVTMITFLRKHFNIFI